MLTTCVCAVADPEQTILFRLEELHKQLASVRDERLGGVPDSGDELDAALAPRESRSKLIVCSVRRPVKLGKSSARGARQ